MLGTNTHLSRLSDRAQSHHQHGMNILSTSQNSTIIHSIPGILTHPFFERIGTECLKHQTLHFRNFREFLGDDGQHGVSVLIVQNICVSVVV